MEPMPTPTPDTPRPPRSRSRLKAAVGGLILAGLLVGGSASVFAASPDPTGADGSPAATEAATEAAPDETSETGTRADCPDKDRATDTDTDTETSS
jgi:hypothetical protein